MESPVRLPPGFTSGWETAYENMAKVSKNDFVLEPGLLTENAKKRETMKKRYHHALGKYLTAYGASKVNPSLPTPRKENYYNKELLNYNKELNSGFYSNNSNDNTNKPGRGAVGLQRTVQQPIQSAFFPKAVPNKPRRYNTILAEQYPNLFGNSKSRRATRKRRRGGKRTRRNRSK